MAQFLKSRRNDTKMTKIKIVISNNVYTKKVAIDVDVDIVNTFLLNIGHPITTN